MQPQYPQQQYAPQYPAAPPAPQYPQQYANPYATTSPQAPAVYGGPQYAPPAPPAAPLPTGTLDAFYEQPSGGGGPAFKFMDANRQPMIGKTYAGLVARPVTNADVRAQTDQSGRPMTYKDGRPKFVLVVPMQVPPSPEFPDGQAGWWVKGQARDELARAMAEAGAPVGPPEAGAGITVTLVGTRPVPGMNPAYQYRITYVRPNGAAAVPALVAAPQYAQAPISPPVQAPPPPAAPPMAAPQASPVPPQPPAAPAGFNEEQAALFARLTGQPQPA